MVPGLGHFFGSLDFGPTIIAHLSYARNIKFYIYYVFGPVWWFIKLNYFFFLDQQLNYFLKIGLNSDENLSWNFLYEKTKLESSRSATSTSASNNHSSLT